MLPVWYTNLDPAHIPNPHDFDRDDLYADAEGCISRAMVSLQTLYATTFPTSIGLDIWPRAWPWVQFLYMYRDHLPNIPPLAGDQFCVDFLMFAGTFFDHEETFSLITSSPGVFFMVAKAWPHALQVMHPSKREVVLNDLHSFIAHDDVVIPANRAEIIDGAGGTLNHVADLIVLYIEAVAPAGHAMDVTSVYFLRGILDFIVQMEPELTSRDSVGHPLGPLGTALASHKFVPTVAELLCALGTVTFDEDEDLAPLAIHISFTILVTILVAPPSNLRRIADGLRHKLLHAIIICALRLSAAQMDMFIDFFLTVILPPSLVFPDILTALNIALDDVEDLVHSNAFKASYMYSRWQDFDFLAEGRIEILKAHDAPDTPSRRACDDLQCGAILERTAVQRCARCLSLYYCSRSCQANDWAQGGHRHACKFYCTDLRNGNQNGGLSLRGGSNAKRTTRERSFIRALLDDDYHEFKPVILVQRAAFMRVHRGEKCLTLYDYTAGPVEIKTLPLNEHTMDELSGPEWDDIVSRAARSGGRMDIDVILFNTEHGPQSIVVPLHRNKSTVHDDLRALADDFPSDEVEDRHSFVRKIGSIVDSHKKDADLLEIH
ncbi:hypothetical protein DFH06DRAFT_603600 [Mycena polygramma]|nr:hypothetical protein DFH06DRAFT_603600 [Mycena polygramma]